MMIFAFARFILSDLFFPKFILLNRKNLKRNKIKLQPSLTQNTNCFSFIIFNSYFLCKIFGTNIAFHLNTFIITNRSHLRIF